MNRSVFGFGVIASNGGAKAASGFAGACATPLFVMNAKLTGSTPTLPRQSALLLMPLL